jgi:hypothetical protein
VAGWEWGNGVVCRRFPDGSWSPPCFIKLRGASLGFTFGMHTIKSCHVLQVGCRGCSALVWGAGALACNPVQSFACFIHLFKAGMKHAALAPSACLLSCPFLCCRTWNRSWRLCRSRAHAP